MKPHLRSLVLPHTEPCYLFFCSEAGAISTNPWLCYCLWENSVVQCLWILQKHPRYLVCGKCEGEERCFKHLVRTYWYCLPLVELYTVIITDPKVRSWHFLLGENQKGMEVKSATLGVLEEDRVQDLTYRHGCSFPCNSPGSTLALY